MLVVPLVLLVQYVVRQLKGIETEIISYCQSHEMSVSYLLGFYKCDCINYECDCVICDSWLS